MAATRIVLAALVIALAPACSDDDDIIIVDDPVGDTLDEGFARGDALADTAAGELTGDDFETVIGKTATILATINDGEIDQSAFAAQIVVAADVFDFANRLIIDHEDANVALDGVVRFYAVPFLPSDTADALAAEFSANLGLLRATPPEDVDFQFVELQVIQHAAALVLLDELALQVGPGEMGDFIAETSIMIDAHLAEAEDLLATFF